MCAKIVIVCPSKRKTGGVELLHQMMDEINSVTSQKSCILYIPDMIKDSLLYPEYRGSSITFDQISRDDFIVLPETMTHMCKVFRGNRIVVWWLSVDNYFGSRKARYVVGNRINPFSLMSVERLRDFVFLHLVQSQYAASFLSSKDIENFSYLSDYISDAYLRATYKIDKKEDLIAYNPAKDGDRFREFRANSSFKYVPLSGMSQSEVVRTLARSKIYVDFGGHPGMDRIPREAAILGNVIITGMRGSAAFHGDVPIPDSYKIDESSFNFAEQLEAKILEVLSSFSVAHSEMDDYREFIRRQRSDFRLGIRDFVSALGLDV